MARSALVYFTGLQLLRTPFSLFVGAVRWKDTTTHTYASFAVVHTRVCLPAAAHTHTTPTFALLQRLHTHFLSFLAVCTGLLYRIHFPTHIPHAACHYLPRFFPFWLLNLFYRLPSLCVGWWWVYYGGWTLCGLGSLFCLFIDLIPYLYHTFQQFKTLSAIPFLPVLTARDFGAINPSV